MGGSGLGPCLGPAPRFTFTLRRSPPLDRPEEAPRKDPSGHGSHMSSDLSAYERQRDANIVRNNSSVRALGLTPPRSAIVVSATARAQATRTEAAQAGSNAGVKARALRRARLYRYGDRLLWRRRAAASQSPPRRRHTAADRGTSTGAAKGEGGTDELRSHRGRARLRRGPRARRPHARGAPDVWHGHAMWLVNGNMFLGVGLRSERLLCGHPLETLAQTVSKVRVFGSVRKVIAGEGGNKSVPCSAGLLSASSSLSVWSRSGRPVPSDRLAALEAALRSQWGSPRDRW